MKKITDEQILGEKGVNLVQALVLKMGFTWHPSNQPVEAGIDGWVELRDVGSGEVKNCWIAVQSKARSEIRESKGSPAFHCKQSDLDYWLEGSAPVVLIVSQPEEELAYWVSVKDYFRGRDVKKERTIHFHPLHDKLTESTAEQWKALGNRYGAGTYFMPARKSETLTSNLLRVNRVAQTIYAADTEYTNIKDARRNLKEVDPYPPWEWTYGDGKRIYSFHDLTQQPWASICDVATVEEIRTRSIAQSDDPARRRIFVQLLKGCFSEITSSWKLRWSKESEVHYFAPSKRDVVRVFRYQSRKNKTKRDVVTKHMHKKEEGRIAYYRHHALSHRFLRFGQDWFLMIEPTYVFTSDGVKPDPYREEHLAGIKAIEGDAAVSGTIKMFAEMLKDRESMFEKPYDFLGFGEIETATCEVGIDDEAWRRIKAKVVEEPEKPEAKSEFGAGLFD